MKSNQPLGIFDSGVGGTSIWKEIHRLLPYEDTIYLADSRNAPYGNKSKEDIISLSIKNTEKLLEMNCKAVIVACNTATTNAISVLREKYHIPIIGIEPAIKPAAVQSRNRSIGILATKGTLSSALFHKTSQAFTKDISVVEIVGEGLVPLIEQGAFDSPQMNELLEHYLKPMIAANIDYLVLGCSHYPYLIPKLKKLLPPNITIIDSGEAVARQTRAILEKEQLLHSSIASGNKPAFYINTRPKTLQLLLKSYQDEIIIEEMNF